MRRGRHGGWTAEGDVGGDGRGTGNVGALGAAPEDGAGAGAARAHRPGVRDGSAKHDGRPTPRGDDADRGEVDVTESVPMDVGKAKTIRIVTATMSAYPPNGTTASLVCSDQSNPPGPYRAIAQSESPFSGPCGGGGDQCTVTARYVYDMDDPFNSVVRQAKLPMAIECTGAFGPQSGAVSALITIDVVTT